MVGWSVGWFVGWLVSLFAPVGAWLVALFACLWIDRLISGLVDRFVDGLIGLLVGWLVCACYFLSTKISSVDQKYEQLSEAEGPACNSTPPPPLSRHSDRRGTDYSSSNSINPKSKVRGFNRTDGTEAEWWSSSPAIIPAIKKKLTPRFSSGDYRRFPSPPILSTRTYSACG